MWQLYSWMVHVQFCTFILKSTIPYNIILMYNVSISCYYSAAEKYTIIHKSWRNNINNYISSKITFRQ